MRDQQDVAVMDLELESVGHSEKPGLTTEKELAMGRASGSRSQAEGAGQGPEVGTSLVH